MSRLLPILGLGLLVLVVVGLSRLMMAPTGSAWRAGRQPMTVRAAARHALGFQVLGAVLAVAASVLLLGGPAGARGTALAPLAGALAWLLVLLAGEHSWPRPEGGRRRARLTVRRSRDFTPARLRVLQLGSAGVLLLSLAAFAVVAGQDGRSLTVVRPTTGASAGPFPGWWYGLPLAGGLLLVLAVAELALAQVRARPAVMDADPVAEHALRRASAHRVLRAAAAGALLTVAGTWVVAGGALTSLATTLAMNGQSSPAWWPVTGWVLVGAGLAAGLLAAVVVAVPAGSRPAPGAAAPTAEPADAHP